MQKRKLGKSDLQITPIGVGAWAMVEEIGNSVGDPSRIAILSRRFTKRSIMASTGLIRRPCTGWPFGRNRRARARSAQSGKNRPYVFTKCSLVWNEKREIDHSLKAESIRRECEASLRRLKIDTIDLYQITGLSRKRVLKKAGPNWRA